MKVKGFMAHNFRYNYGKPDFALPYRGNDDTPLSLPLAPKNVEATSPYLIGAIDVRWDTPTSYTENDNLIILGTKVYRSFDSPEGTYDLLTTTPTTVLFYRDETGEVSVIDEDPVAGGRLIAGTNATGDWIVRTYNRPLVAPGTNGEQADNRAHVTIRIKPTSTDAFQTVPAFKVIGDSGEIYLIKDKIFDSTNNVLLDPVLPDLNRGGEILVSYTHLNNQIQTDIYRKIYYKVTTVATDPKTGNTIESPLDEVEAVSIYDMEKVDWIWAEAIRRNRWLLEQAGERVKVFIRKWAGEKCQVCWDEEYHQAKEFCTNCYGTGRVGGYVGPYDIIVAPPETEKTVELTDIGLHVNYDFNTWTGPYPLLTDRDFIVRQNNQRFSIAHVNPQGSRGAIYQQHFNMAPLDQKDIRYSVPIHGGASSVPTAWNKYRETKPSDASPVITDKPGIPDEYELRGRTVTFENICY
jgi:hypothetical protein